MFLILLILAAFGLLTSSVFAGMVVAATPRFLRARRAAMSELAARDFTPALSLIKPLHGADPGLEEYLVSFYEQDYAEFEILFCARTEQDAGLEIARRVAARYPHVATQILWTGGEPDYINAKVASMELMEKHARHEILVISDSDVRVRPGHLRAVALPFKDAQVGGMTCLYRGVAAEGGLWARLEAVGMTVEMTAGVLVANMIEGMQFVLGPTMAFRRETLRKMGGFAVTADYCADDFVLGNETFKQGERVALSHHIIEHMVINSSFVQSMRHQARWMQSTRFSRPKGHFGTSLTFSLPFGLLGLAAGVFSDHLALGLALFGWSVLTRWAIALAAGWAAVEERSWLTLFVLYPVRDLMGLGFWAASYASSKVLWRGKVFQLLPGGKMVKAGPSK
jgi:ceramide glucosyltransferase